MKMAQGCCCPLLELKANEPEFRSLVKLKLQLVTNPKAANSCPNHSVFIWEVQSTGTGLWDPREPESTDWGS